MGHRLNVTTTFEVEVALAGTYNPGAPEQGPTYSSGGQPAEEPSIEDVEATSLGGLRLRKAPPAERGSHPGGVWETVDLLEGLDDGARAKLLANVLAFMGPEAMERAIEADLP